MVYRMNRYLVVMILIGMCLTMSSCALLQAPVELVKAPLTLIGEVFKLAQKMPKPPPGVFF